MIGVIVAVLAGVGVVYEVFDDLLPSKPLPKVLPPAPGTTKPIVLPPQVPVTPHVVPGGTYVYTAPQAAPDLVQASANALAAVNPCDKSSEQLVRNFQGAAGLAQLTAPGASSVTPPGTDGRYGHDVAAVLAKYVPNAPPPCATRPSWWGAVGAYVNK
jgi:hypothetical protein